MINIQKNIPLAQFTTFRIGGPAEFFAEVGSDEELIEALEFAEKNNLDFFVLGGGSNLLISDQGFNGLIIRMKLSDFKIDINNSLIEAGAGVPLAKLVRDSAESGLSGMEWAAGIPGAVGGAIRGNAGAFGGNISDTIESVKVLKITNNSASPAGEQDTITKKITNYKLQDCLFGYRDSVFKQNPDLVILSAVFKLQKGDKAEMREKISGIISQRKAKQPQGVGSAGSFFVNPIVENEKLREEFEKEKNIKCKDKKIPAGWLIERAGLGGKKMGGAMLSDIHSNFIVNAGGATAENVIMLASFVKQQVRDKFGVELREEIQYLGF